MLGCYGSAVVLGVSHYYRMSAECANFGVLNSVTDACLSSNQQDMPTKKLSEPTTLAATRDEGSSNPSEHTRSEVQQNSF